MTNRNVWIARALLLPLAFSLTGGPALAQTQSNGNSAQQAPAPPQAQQAPPADQQPAQPPRGLVNPAQGPLEPVPSTQTPDQAAPAQPQQEESATPNAPTPQNKPERPLGAAVGQAAETRGGPASKPAGTAIAPAKQRQMRSLFLKVGAIAAAGAAIGAVVALTRGTPSNPPGAR